MKGFITGSSINWPSWVLFQLSRNSSIEGIDRNPLVELGTNVSVGGTAARATRLNQKNYCQRQTEPSGKSRHD